MNPSLDSVSNASSTSGPLGSSAKLTRQMEDDVFALLGALLGMLEVLTIDAQEPLSARQQRVVNDALKLGDKLRSRVEAMVTLLSDDSDPRHPASDYPVQRLIDHAVRGANWSAAERGVHIALPAADALAKLSVRVDAARVDRALRAITDTLVQSMAAGSELHVSVTQADATISIQLFGRAKEPHAFEWPQLPALGWQHVIGLHGGRMHVNKDEATVRIDLVRGELP
jgi:hypothetical protein